MDEQRTLRVAVAGGSGLIGTALLQALGQAGHEPVQLVRHPAEQPGQRQWEPGSGWIDGPGLSDVDAVICLSGAGIAGRPWTDKRRELLRSSRIEPVSAVVAALADAPRCQTFLCGSAVGYYGTAGDAELTEEHVRGEGFLPDLVEEWEQLAATAPNGVRVVSLRTGLVLSGSGGLLASLAPLFRLGAGGRLGSGRQWMPWISLADHVRAQVHLLGSQLSGPVNLSAPTPVTNREFTRTLAAAVHRPAIIPTPLLPIRVLMGTDFVDELLLASQRAVPAKLLADDFDFGDTSFAETVRAEVG